jgi:hypothetical protein
VKAVAPYVQFDPEGEPPLGQMYCDAASEDEAALAAEFPTALEATTVKL